MESDPDPLAVAAAIEGEEFGGEEGQAKPLESHTGRDWETITEEGNCK